jgi:hypothetical protein
MSESNVIADSRTCFTSNGNLLVFSAYKNLRPEIPSLFHLEAIKESRTIWKGARSTPVYYSGGFPEDGWFDIGNGVVFPGGDIQTVGNIISWSYHGEFWKSQQTNKYNFVHENGLMLGQCGNAPNGDFGFGPGVAGNVLQYGMVRLNQSTAYIYHAEESPHSGLHRWKISGLDTILEQTGEVIDGKASNEDLGKDLMAGLPFRAESLEKSVAGWIRNPATNNNKIKTDNEKYWSVETGKMSYDRFCPTDILIQCNPDQNDVYSVTRDLGDNNASSWTLTGQVAYPIGEVNDNVNNGGVYFDVLDANKKIIIRFYPQMKMGGAKIVRSVIANSREIIKEEQGGSNVQKVVRKSQLLKIFVNKDGATFNYAEYPTLTVPIFDSNAHWRSPKTLEISFTINGRYKRIRTIDLKDLIFSTTN